MGWFGFVARNFRFLSFGFGLNAFIAVGQTFFISLFNQDFQAALDLNNGQIATTYGAAMLAGSFLVMRTGWIYDHIDLRICCAALLTLTSLSAASLASTTNLTLLFFGLFGMRYFGGTMLGLGAQAAMARYFDDDRGRASAIANAGYTCGFAIFPLLGAQLMSVFGWRGAWWVICAGLLAVIPIVQIQLKGQRQRHLRYLEKISNAAVQQSGSAATHSSVKDMLRDRRFYLLAPGMLAVPGILFTFQFHQLSLVAEKGWSLDIFAAGYVLFAIASLTSNIIVGEVIDRYGARRMLPFYLLPMIPALFAVGILDHPIAVPIYMVGTGLTFGISLVANITLWAEIYGSRHIGAIRGFVASINTFLASMTMALAGWLLDWGVPVSAQALVAGMILIVAAIMLTFVARVLPIKTRSNR
ncbi:MAG: MFS transporter [Rhodobacteraceae bacterium]|nr:MFS transporter [Paracoccaceae bacterium]